MQNVSDDMDELFRRAAEGYPLNTDSADWNAVVKKLSSEKSVADNAFAKNKNYKHLLWLLLLLPLGWIYNNYVFNKNEKPSNTTSKNIATKSLLHTSLSKNINPTLNTVKQVNVLPNNSLALRNSSGIQSKERGKLNSIVTENSSTTFIPDKQSTLITEPVAALSGKKESEFVSEVNNKKDINPDSYRDKNETTAINPDSYRDKNNNEETTKNPQKRIRKQQEHGLYAGIIISPDISTVKFQSVKNIGVSMGLLVGYRLSKKISVESGVSWNKKNYYSDGKYFSTKYSQMPANVQIKKVDGECNMIEIPLVIKYNLTTGKTNFSTSAGFSSYFMKKEKYDYAVDNNGQQYQYSSTYNNSSTNLLAVANFSVGYNRALRQNITLRIEPYLKIPLKGIGIGSLPIMSTGLNIGITKKIF